MFADPRGKGRKEGSEEFQYILKRRVIKAGNSDKRTIGSTHI